MELKNGGGLKAPLEVIWSNDAQAGTPEDSCPGPYLDGFWIALRR